MIAGQDADALQRFTETHVIAEDTVQFIFVQESKPVHTGLLVTPQFGCYWDRNLVVRYAGRGEKLL